MEGARPKKGSVADTIASRNPLNRPRSSVHPTDLYGTEAKNAEDELPRQDVSVLTPAVGESDVTATVLKSGTPDAAGDDPIEPYSTYLKRSLKKKLKLGAAVTPKTQQEIVSTAVAEYFERNPVDA